MVAWVVEVRCGGRWVPESVYMSRDDARGYVDAVGGHHRVRKYLPEAVQPFCRACVGKVENAAPSP